MNITLIYKILEGNNEESENIAHDTSWTDKEYALFQSYIENHPDKIEDYLNEDGNLEIGTILPIEIIEEILPEWLNKEYNEIIDYHTEVFENDPDTEEFIDQENNIYDEDWDVMDICDIILTGFTLN